MQNQSKPNLEKIEKSMLERNIRIIPSWQYKMEHPGKPLSKRDKWRAEVRERKEKR